MSQPIKVPLVGGPAHGHTVRFADHLPRYITVPVLDDADDVLVSAFCDDFPPAPPRIGQVQYTVTMERYPPGPEGPRFFAYCREAA